jgi:hypothetical protein
MINFPEFDGPIPGFALEALNIDGVDIVDPLMHIPSVDPVVVGGPLPELKGVSYDHRWDKSYTFSADQKSDKTLIIASPTVLRSDSPDCLEMADRLEELHQEGRREGITVVQFTRQPIEEIARLVNGDVNGKIYNHQIVSVDEQTALNMGAVIHPLPGATEGYWGDGSQVTSKTLTVASKLNEHSGQRTVLYRERPMSQRSFAETQFEAAYVVAKVAQRAQRPLRSV